MPFFSVLIPSFNRPEYLPLAVASVLASDFADFELIVSDDCSPRIEEIASAIAPLRADRRLIFERQPQNLGEANNRHFLMVRASGYYRIILGDDDLLTPTALSSLHNTISQQPRFDIYLFGYSVVDEGGRVFETRRAMVPLELSLEATAVVEDLFCSDFLPFWLFHPATFCFSDSIHLEVEPNASIGIGDDLLFLFDAILSGKRAYIIPDVLFSYRKFLGSQFYHQGNLSSRRLANIATRTQILYNLLGRQTLPPKLHSFVRSRVFRNRLLYNSISGDPDANSESIRELALSQEYLVEALKYGKPLRRFWLVPWLQIQRVRKYVQYFGIPGLIESARVYWQRRLYKKSTGKC